MIRPFQNAQNKTLILCHQAIIFTILMPFFSSKKKKKRHATVFNFKPSSNQKGAGEVHFEAAHWKQTSMCNFDLSIVVLQWILNGCFCAAFLSFSQFESWWDIETPVSQFDSLWLFLIVQLFSSVHTCTQSCLDGGHEQLIYFFFIFTKYCFSLILRNAFY